MKKNDIKKVVRKKYAEIARGGAGSLCRNKSCCESPDLTKVMSNNIGYSEKEIKIVPEGSNLGLGCGNPVALASLKKGETVLDLGAGAGFDCFLAAQRVGKNGKVIGVDMTTEMIDKARENGQKGGYDNVEFRLGEIENLPAADNSVDAVISNCVINLSADKRQVFQEAFRVLKPGGRLMISDLVLLKELPDEIRNSVQAYVGCIAGALLKEDYLSLIKEAGFQDVKLLKESQYPATIVKDSRDQTGKSGCAVSADAVKLSGHISMEKIEELANSVLSITVYGVKPEKIK